MKRTKPISFAVRLGELIAEADVSIADVAERSGLSRQLIHQLLNDEQRPKWATACALADALGVSTERFR